MKVVEAYEPADGFSDLRLRSSDSVIRFDEGLIGFPECKDFVLMENESLTPFWLLQSVNSPNVGFLVLDATTLVSDYCNHVPLRDWESLGMETPCPLAFIIVSIGSNPETSTGNLQAPLLINYEKMTGKQVILTDSGFSVRHPLV